MVREATLMPKGNTETLIYGIVATYFIFHPQGIRYNQIVEKAKFYGRSERTVKRSISLLETRAIIERIVDASTKPVSVMYKPSLKYADWLLEVMKKDIFLRRFYALSEWFKSLKVSREEKIERLTHILRNMFLIASQWPALAIQWALKEKNKQAFLHAFILRWDGDILFRISAILQLCWEYKDIADEALERAINWMDEDFEALAKKALEGVEKTVDFSKIYP